MSNVAFAPRVSRVSDYGDIREMLADLVKARDARAEEAERLAQQLQRNRAVGEAIGIVMSRYTVDDQAAELIISTLAVERGVSDHDVALDIIADFRGAPLA